MSIQERKWKGSTTYRCRVYHKRRVVADATFDSREEAEAFELLKKAEIATGSHVDRSKAKRLKLGDALDRYLEEYAKIENKQKTYICKKSQARQIKRFPIADYSLAEITSSHVTDFKKARSKEVGGNAVRLELALISHLYTVARSEWHMHYLSNPVETTKKPSVAHTARDRRLEDGEYERIMRAAAKHNTGIMVHIIDLAIETAMREGEIAGIRPRHVDMKSRIVHLPETKNDEARDVPLSLKATEIMREMLKLGHDPVFNITSNAISRAFRKICKRTTDDDDKKTEAIEDLKFHDLRHEATSKLFEKGLSTEQVKKITGHKTYSMLARYTKLRAKDLVDLLN